MKLQSLLISTSRSRNDVAKKWQGKRINLKGLRKARRCDTLGWYGKQKQMLRAYPSGVSMASRSAVQAFDRGSKSSLSRPTQPQATATGVFRELRFRDSLSSRYGVLIICAVVG